VSKEERKICVSGQYTDFTRKIQQYNRTEDVFGIYSSTERRRTGRAKQKIKQQYRRGPKQYKRLVVQQ
jgi:hypothetical protein